MVAGISRLICSLHYPQITSFPRHLYDGAEANMVVHLPGACAAGFASGP